MRKALIVLCLVALVPLLGFSAGTSEKAQPSSLKDIGFHDTGLPIVDKKVTLKFIAPQSPLQPAFGDMVIFQRLEAATNVHIVWQNIAQNVYDEKKNLLLASGDLPDGFYEPRFTASDVLSYGQQGTLIPLEQYISKYVPNLVKAFQARPGAKGAVTMPDGHIYNYPTIGEMAIPDSRGGAVEIGASSMFTSINKKWLDKLGLPLPTTLPQYHDALVAFKNKDPNGNGKQDEIPLSFMEMWWCADIGDLIGSFGLPDPSDRHILQRNGKVIFTAMQPEYKQALSYFHNWYTEGLIDPESFTQDDKAYLSKGKNPDYVLGSYVWWETTEVVGVDRTKDYELMPPLIGPNGQKPRVGGRELSPSDPSSGLIVTKANKYPEVTARWVNTTYEPDWSVQLTWGPIGIIYEKDASGKLNPMDITKETKLSMGEYMQVVSPRGGPVIYLADYYGKIFDMEPRAMERLIQLRDIYMPYLETERFGGEVYTKAELDTINQLEPELKNYVNEQRAKWLVDGGVDAQWDGYLAQLKSLGIDRYLAALQAALDRKIKAQQ